MPRGAKIDREATELAHRFIPMNFPRLRDPRSFVTTKGHLRLYGWDMSRARERCLERYRFRCVTCKIRVLPGVKFYHPRRGEAHHIVSRAKCGCDCDHNLELRCALHHRGKKGVHA